MTSTRPLRLTALAALCTLAATAAWAQDAGHFYGGLSIGQSRAKFDEEKMAKRLIGLGLAPTIVQRDMRDKGYRLFLGYQLNEYVALEGGYFDLGRFDFSATTVPAGTLDGQLKLRGVNADLVGRLPLTERLSALARVGVQSTKTSDHFSGTGAVTVLDPSPSQRATNVKLGAGLQYTFSPSFSMRAEAERYRVNDATGGSGHVNLVSVSLVFPFGHTPAAAPRAAAPAYIAQVPIQPRVVVVEPAPVVVAAAPVVEPPPRRRVSFSAESLFAFDRSDLKVEGRAGLDTFSRELETTRFDTVQVEGHTDRLGSQAYNQKLSEQRADAVKAYLVASGRVDAAKISSVGKSESEPVTKADDCKGTRASAQLIACLQPDRRVDIEVVGTR